ncbi:glycoside hydrolase superfamily [Lentinula edodes]|uniref:glycoside hydrolase superfamily n=1 Tax=Lentinula edodes TaxID=5353 RepID=UPI001E8EF041|nr:glycoside hydrolase superfamily [Lentinula edodes]KAH7877124.1 glycoside hydrolase superfamily [Lentinula edodes]
MISPFSAALSLLSLTTLYAHGQITSISETETKIISSAWLAGWHTANATPTFDLNNISWSKYTDVFFSFALPTADTQVLTLNGSNGDALPSFVHQAHANGVNAHVSVGGWGGSIYFSTAMGSAENRTQFVKAITDFATNYSLDGINFDWEYPNKQGIGCNIVNANDTDNFLAFLQELRTDPVGANLTLSAATAITPFFDSKGNALTNVSAFADVFDFVTVMNYDVWGSWSTGVGPNAPLNDSCAAKPNQQGSAVSAVAAWYTAGMPVEKIVLGVPSYGHSFSVNQTSAFVSSTELAAYPPFNATAFPLGDSWDTGATEPDACGLLENNGGVYDFWSLIENGYLDTEGNFTSEFPHRFDECSQTPYLYVEDAELMISFDNAESFTAKGNFIAEYGLAGFAMWEAGGDFNDILLDAIRAAVGLDDC